MQSPLETGAQNYHYFRTMKSGSRVILQRRWGTPTGFSVQLVSINALHFKNT